MDKTGAFRSARDPTWPSSFTYVAADTSDFVLTIWASSWGSKDLWLRMEGVESTVLALLRSEELSFGLIQALQVKALGKPKPRGVRVQGTQKDGQ